MAECFGFHTSIDEELETLTDVQRPQNLLDFANQSRKSGLYTDVTIVVGKERFPAHRVVLASMSDYFPPLFKLDENESGEVTLNNIKPEEFAIFLKYAYTGYMDINKDNVQDILITSDYINAKHVKELCIKFMADNFDNENICDILRLGFEYSIHELKEKASDFWVHHLDDISKTEKFSQMDAKFLEKLFVDDNLILYDGRYTNTVLNSKKREELVLSSLLRYLSKTSISNPEITEMLIRTVRLPQLSQDVVMECLENFKTLKDNTIIQKYIKLQEVAVKCLQRSKKDSYVMESTLPDAQEIPDSWFKERKCADFVIYHGCSLYASEVQHKPMPYFPNYLYNDHRIQIKRIEYWLRLWKDKVVIGGLAVLYRSTSEDIKSSLVYSGGDCSRGEAHHVAELEPDELIIKVIVGSDYLIHRIGFETNKGRTLGPFGDPQGEERIEYAQPSSLSYLHDINYDTLDENESGEVTLHNIKSEEFAIIFDYAYTGKVGITNDNVQDILITSDYLNVGYVKGICIKFMAANLDYENVCDVLVFGTEYPIPELAKKANEYWIHHLDEISQTVRFSQMDAKFLEQFFVDDNLILYDGRYANKVLTSKKREELVFNSVLRYLSKASVSNPEITETLIRTVRLPQISKDVVTKCLNNFKTLKDNKIIKKYIKLQEVAVKYLQGIRKDASVVTTNPEAQEIPHTWFKERIYGIVMISHGSNRYASGNEILATPYPPECSNRDRSIEIQQIEIWLRRWDGRVVIGGLTLSFRSTSKDADDPSLVYRRGHCPTGEADHVVKLEPDEFIVKVVVGSGWLIDRLGFETNQGRVLGPFGGPGGSEEIEFAPQGELSYLFDISCDTVNTQEADAIFNLMLRWIRFS